MFISWLIYGNFLYYSSDNNCKEDDYFLNYLMLGLLILGYFSMLLHCIVVACIGAIKYQNYKNKNRKKILSASVLRSLSKTKFS